MPKHMSKQMEFSKKIAVLRKLFRMALISEAEYIMARNKIMDEYMVVGMEEMRFSETV